MNQAGLMTQVAQLFIPPYARAYTRLRETQQKMGHSRHLPLEAGNR